MRWDELFESPEIVTGAVAGVIGGGIEGSSASYNPMMKFEWWFPIKKGIEIRKFANSLALFLAPSRSTTFSCAVSFRYCLLVSRLLHFKWPNQNQKRSRRTLATLPRHGSNCGSSCPQSSYSGMLVSSK